NHSHSRMRPPPCCSGFRSIGLSSPPCLSCARSVVLAKNLDWVCFQLWSAAILRRFGFFFRFLQCGDSLRSSPLWTLFPWLSLQKKDPKRRRIAALQNSHQPGPASQRCELVWNPLLNPVISARQGQRGLSLEVGKLRKLREREEVRTGRRGFVS